MSALAYYGLGAGTPPPLTSSAAPVPIKLDTDVYSGKLVSIASNIHLPMSVRSSAAPVADIETYSGMCGRCEEAGGR